MRIAVCEDIERDRSHIVALLTGLLEEGDTITEFEDGEQLLNYCRPDYPFDLTFLDIRMPNKDGAEVAGRIRELAPGAVIVVLTRYREYAIDFYRYRALDYLIKPVTLAKLKDTVDKARQEIVQQKSLLVRARGRSVRIPIHYICYVEIFDHTIIVHSSKGRYEYTGSLSALAGELEIFGFFMLNHSQLVNLDCVSGYQSADLTAYLTNGESLKIAEGRLKSFKRTLAGYIDAMNKGAGT